MHFSNYTADELVMIARKMIEERKDIKQLEDDAWEKVESVCKVIAETPNGGNARAVRDLFRKARENRALRTATSNDPDTLMTLVAADFSDEEDDSNESDEDSNESDEDDSDA